MTGSTYEGADGTVTVTAGGLQFDRPKLAALAKKSERSYLVVWDQVVDVESTAKVLRAVVAGEQPRGATSDPYAVAIRHGSQHLAQAVVDDARPRCRGSHPEPTAAPVDAPRPVAVESTDARLDRMTQTALTWSIRLMTLQLVLLLVPLVLFLGALVFFAYLVLFD